MYIRMSIITRLGIGICDAFGDFPSLENSFDEISKFGYTAEKFHISK